MVVRTREYGPTRHGGRCCQFGKREQPYSITRTPTVRQEDSLGLPAEYGVDDLPLVLQDRQFENGFMVAPDGMMARMAGWRGNTIVVNGTPNAVTRVPGRRVRLRLLNGSNARIFNLSFPTEEASNGLPAKAVFSMRLCR